jgi:ectoine hydroxylase-related dioxygenase (phytanoyl-CoA dioxygenase family)
MYTLCVCVCRSDVHCVVGDDVFVVVEAVLDVLPVLPPLKELLQRTRVEQRSGGPRGRTTETQQKHNRNTHSLGSLTGGTVLGITASSNEK